MQDGDTSDDFATQLQAKTEELNALKVTATYYCILVAIWHNICVLFCSDIVIFFKNTFNEHMEQSKEIETELETSLEEVSLMQMKW